MNFHHTFDNTTIKQMANLIQRGFRYLFGSSESRSSSFSTLKNPTTWFMNLLGGGTNAGVNVTTERALGISALWSAVDIISSSIASLPFKVYRKLENGDREEATGNPINNLLTLLPNDIYLPYNFWYSMVSNALLWGGSAAQIIRDDNNRARRLKLLKGRVTPVEGENGKLYYAIGANIQLYEADDILFLPGLLSTDGFIGRGIVATFRETFGEGIAAQIFGQKFFANGAHLKGYISFPQALGDQAFDRLKRSWSQSYEGMENAGKTAILEEGGQFNPLTVSPRDAMYIDVKKGVVEEVSRITRVPLHMLQSLERATFNNIEVLGLDFVKYTLAPWLTKIQQECNRKLFYQNEIGNYYTEHNLNSLLRGDSKSRAQFYKELFYLGAITPNQIRQKENMQSYQEGNRYYIQQNLTPADKIDQLIAQIGAPKNNNDE